MTQEPVSTGELPKEALPKLSLREEILERVREVQKNKEELEKSNQLKLEQERKLKNLVLTELFEHIKTLKGLIINTNTSFEANLDLLAGILNTSAGKIVVNGPNITYISLTGVPSCQRLDERHVVKNILNKYAYDVSAIVKLPK